jgi:hypothetical protein
LLSVISRIASDLPQRWNIRQDARQAGGHGFRYRDPEALSAGRCKYKSLPVSHHFLWLRYGAQEANAAF